MSLSVIDKYVVKKEKDLLEYAKILESIISIDNNKMWQTKKEFVSFAKEIIEIYGDAYYFQNNIPDFLHHITLRNDIYYFP